MYFVLILTILVLMTISLGYYFYTRPSINNAKGKLRFILGANVSIFILLLLVSTFLTFSGSSFAYGTETVNTDSSASSSSAGLGYIAAAVSTGLATIGAGYAVGSVGSSALGAVSENPKILGKTLIFVGLAEGIAIYGLIISILILGRLS